MNKRVEILRYLNNILLLVLSGIIIHVLFDMIPIKVILCAEAVVVILLYVYSRIKIKSFFYPHFSESIFFIALMILLRIAQRPEGTIYVLLGEMIFVVLMIFFYNARQVINVMQPYKDRSAVPYKKIRKANQNMVRTSAVIAIIFMFICTLFDYGRQILEFIHLIVYRVLRFIFSFFEFAPTEEYEYEPRQNMGGTMEGLIPEEYTDDTIWHTLWQVLFYIIAVIVFAGIIVLLAKGVKELYKRFRSSKNSVRDRILKDKIEYLNPLEKKENALRDNRITFSQRLSNSGRVRLLYKKYIQRGKGYANVKSSLTPTELELTSRDRYSRATEIYEKARYSNIPITQMDVKKMKELIR